MASEEPLVISTSSHLAMFIEDASDYPTRALPATSLPTRPFLPHLTLVILEAVLQIACVSFPGYVIASFGHFDAEKQKFVANLNMVLFTPCLIFTRLASQLDAKMFYGLAFTPGVFVGQILITWLVPVGISKLFRLQASCRICHGHTLKCLRWDSIPGDNDDKVAARGFLYLLIFQQLDKLQRWSRGYHVLLASKERYSECPQHNADEMRYHCADEDEEVEHVIVGLDQADINDANGDSIDSHTYIMSAETVVGASPPPVPHLHDGPFAFNTSSTSPSYVANGPVSGRLLGQHTEEHPLTAPHRVGSCRGTHHCDSGAVSQTMASVSTKMRSIRDWVTAQFSRLHYRFPRPVRLAISLVIGLTVTVGTNIWKLMDPPLLATLMAIFVVSVRGLRELFFEDGSLINNSVTTAVRSGGGVSVPLLLVVLGANLAGVTTYDEARDPEEDQIGTKLLIACLLSRILLPSLIMAPILVTAKSLGISILNDSMFLAVCFLLTGAPSALQLAQICQISNVFKKTVGRLLLQSYVLWLLPSTLVGITLAFEVVPLST